MIPTHTQCYILHFDLESGNKHELISMLVCFTYSNSCKQGYDVVGKGLNEIYLPEIQNTGWPLNESLRRYNSTRYLWPS